MIPEKLLVIKELVYDACGFSISGLSKELESAEYEACTFLLNGMRVMHRSSKITPTKTGQFVTLWKRNKQGVTAPFDISDKFDVIILTVSNGAALGQFVFPKTILLKHGVLSEKNKGGKRGFRVYPPWDKVTNKQAEKSQHWQLQFFVPIAVKNTTDLPLVKKLYQSLFEQSVD